MKLQDQGLREIFRLLLVCSEVRSALESRVQLMSTLQPLQTLQALPPLPTPATIPLPVLHEDVSSISTFLDSDPKETLETVLAFTEKLLNG